MPGQPFNQTAPRTQYSQTVHIHLNNNLSYGNKLKQQSSEMAKRIINELKQDLVNGPTRRWHVQR